MEAPAVLLPEKSTGPPSFLYLRRENNKAEQKLPANDKHKTSPPGDNVLGRASSQKGIRKPRVMLQINPEPTSTVLATASAVDEKALCPFERLIRKSFSSCVEW